MSKFKDNWKLINKGIEHTWLCPCGERNREGEVCPECGKEQSAKKDIGIKDAGSVPNSLLARQDLETSKTQGTDWAEAYNAALEMIEAGMSSGDVVAKLMSKYGADTKTAQDLTKTALSVLKNKYKVVGKSATSEASTDAKEMKRSGYTRGFIKRRIKDNYGLSDSEAEMVLDEVFTKASIEQTGKQLDKVADKAEEAETSKEKTQLIGKMKEIQLKRQKAVIDARAPETSKSFKDFWKKNER